MKEKTKEDMAIEFMQLFKVNGENTKQNRLHFFQLLLEELCELGNAMGITTREQADSFYRTKESEFFEAGDKEATFDALIDMEYYQNQIKIVLGIPESKFDEGYRRVHNSNLEKSINGEILKSDGSDGIPIGKVIKPEGWKCASLKDLL